MGGLRGAVRAGRNLYRLASGRWVVRLYERRQGRPEREIWRAFDRREDAVRFRASWKSARAFRTAGLSPTAAESRLTVADLFDRYVVELRSLHRSEEQVRKVGQAKRLVVSALGEHHPAPVSREDLVTVARHAWATTKTHGDAIKRAFGLLKTAHRRAGLPVPVAPAVVVERRGRRVLPPDQMRAFFAALPPGSVERVAALLVLTAGLREWETFRVRVGDVDLEKGTIASTVKKGSAAAAVALGRHPLSPGLRQDIRRLIEALPPGTKAEDPLLGIVSSRAGEEPRRHALTPFSLRASLRAACRRAGVPVVHGLGWLRNAAATRLVEGGAPVETARRLLGHASTRTTEAFYDKAEMWKSRVDASRKLEAALSPPPSPRQRRAKRSGTPRAAAASVRPRRVG